MHIDAGVHEVFGCDSKLAEMGQPFGIDLCQANVLAAIGIEVHRVGIESGLLRSNGVEHLRVHAVALRRAFPTA